MKEKEGKNTEKLKKMVQKAPKKASEDCVDTQCKESSACLNKTTARNHANWLRL